MNHTDVQTERPRVTPRRRVGTWVLSHTQMGLLLGCVGVGLILAFGGGFIAGVWYQASEHITPYAERQDTVAVEPAPPAESPDLTFYSMLTRPENPPPPGALPGTDKAAARSSGQSDVGGSGGAAKTPERPPEAAVKSLCQKPLNGLRSSAGVSGAAVRATTPAPGGAAQGPRQKRRRRQRVTVCKWGVFAPATRQTA